MTALKDMLDPSSYFMEGHQGHTKVSQYSYCVIVADVMRGDLHLKMNR